MGRYINILKVRQINRQLNRQKGKYMIFWIKTFEKGKVGEEEER